MIRFCVFCFPAIKLVFWVVGGENNKNFIFFSVVSVFLVDNNFLEMGGRGHFLTLTRDWELVNTLFKLRFISRRKYYWHLCLGINLGIGIY